MDVSVFNNTCSFWYIYIICNTHLLAVLGLGDGVGAALAVVLGYIFTLPERGTPVLQNMTNAESIAIKPALFAELWAV